MKTKEKRGMNLASRICIKMQIENRENQTSEEEKEELRRSKQDEVKSHLTFHFGDCGYQW